MIYACFYQTLSLQRVRKEFNQDLLRNLRVHDMVLNFMSIPYDTKVCVCDVQMLTCGQRSTERQTDEGTHAEVS